MLQAETLPGEYFALLADNLQMLVRSHFDI